MSSDYTFLTDHSYSLRPDDDELSLNKREEKTKKRQRSSNRTNKTASPSNRTVSIDRSSSDKENNSLILSNSNDVPISVTTSSSSSNARSNKKKTIGSRGSRLSTRTVTKTGVKSTQGSIVKKKKVLNRGKTKLLNISQMDSYDAPPSLSIEERVKLRRTKPLLPSTATVVEKKTGKSIKSQPKKPPTVQNDVKQIRQSMMNNNSSKKVKATKTSPPVVVSTNKTNKLFLGSGLDLDNIVLGNRQRRCVQT